jgi:transcription initiation factor TFIIIB Brf1 subunit/transcription initiation factor TFIIB
MKEEHSATLHPEQVVGNCPGHRPHLACDGEYVCTRCGTVLSDGSDWQAEESITDQSTSGQAASPKSNVNLFLAHKLGGREVKSLPGLSTTRSLEMANRDTTVEYGAGGKKKKSADAYLSRLSNACSKLGLTHAESEYAWRLFARLYSELSNDEMRVTNASEIACYAIAAGAAATTRRVLGERAVARAVMFGFHSKSIRDMYCIRRIIETRSQAVTGIAKPALTASAKWIRGRL